MLLAQDKFLLPVEEMFAACIQFHRQMTAQILVAAQTFLGAQQKTFPADAVLPIPKGHDFPIHQFRFIRYDLLSHHVEIL
jgi:hypothetical protein